MMEYTKEGLIIDGKLLTLEEITSNVNRLKIEEEKLGLMKITWAYSRNFDGIVETIVLPIDRLNQIKSIIVGLQVYFGEINGKHSEIYGDIDEEDVTITEDSDKINRFMSRVPSGHEYDHSFLGTLHNNMQDGQFEDMSDEAIKTFGELIP